MPCWYYDKKELRNTPSARDGIDYATEARYRKEGARFIIDCGTKLGLRYDSCATGVVFFHRFYMFHSFKEFHRYVTAACCLFLAGKTEETPKKCKDLIKTTRSMLTDAQFAVFGEDPKEEVMTLERILLQTIKFDLMVEHPYAYLLKFAKLIKADKAKVQKLVQMAWTFINDSMCTTLCLQWEPEVIAVSLMYLATRLNKTEITDWIGKPPGFRGKWWESLVEDVNQELLEDVCHQVLDLYQPSQPAKSGHDETPPQATARPSTSSATVSSSSKRPRTPPPGDTSKSRGPTPSKVARDDKRPASPPRSSTKEHDRSLKAPHSGSVTKTPCQSSNSGLSTPGSAPVVPVTTTASNYSQNNPYMSQQMYSSSFMSQEGSQSIQSLVGGRSTYSGTSNYTQPPPAQPPPASVPVHPTTSAYSQPSYQQATYQNAAGYQQPPPQPPNYQQPPPAVSGYSQPSTYTHSYSYPPPSQPSYSTNNQYQTPPPNYNQTYPSQYGAGQQYPASYQYNSQSYQNFTSTPSYQQPQTPQPPPPGLPPHVPPPPRQTTGLPSVRITGRPS